MLWRLSKRLAQIEIEKKNIRVKTKLEQLGANVIKLFLSVIYGFLK